MVSYLTTYRRLYSGDRTGVLFATVLRVGASADWTRAHADEIAAKADNRPDLPPIVAMQVGDQPPEGMEKAA